MDIIIFIQVTMIEIQVNKIENIPTLILLEFSQKPFDRFAEIETEHSQCESIIFSYLCELLSHITFSYFEVYSVISPLFSVGRKTV